MKRMIGFCICLILLVSFSGCNTDHNVPSVDSGIYYAVGDYKQSQTPGLYLDTEQNRFSIFLGIAVSVGGEYGTYEVVDGTLVATSQSATFQFDIVDENTLVLIDHGDSKYFEKLVNTQFVLSEDGK